MSIGYLDARKWGGGDKAIYTSMINHDLVNSSGVLYITLTLSQPTIINIPDSSSDKLNLIYTDGNDSPTYTKEALKDINTVIVDEPLSINNLKLNIKTGGFIIYLSESYKDSSKYTVETGAVSKILSIEDLKPHIFDASSIRGGFRAISVSDPAFVGLMKSMADNSRKIKIFKDSIINTVVVDCTQTLWRKLHDELFNLDYKIEFDPLTYIILNSENNEFDKDDFSNGQATTNYKKFNDCFIVNAPNSYVYYVLNSGIYKGIKKSENVALVVNESVNLYNLSQANDGEDFYKFYVIYNYGANYSFIHHEKLIVSTTIFNSGIWRSHNNLLCQNFFNRCYAGFYHEDFDNEGKEDTERFNITLTGYFATNETGITKFGSKYDIIFNPVPAAASQTTILTNNGGSFNFADNSTLKITSSNKNKKFVVSNFGTLKFDNDLTLDNNIEFFNHDEGIIYLEKNFSVDRLDNLIFNNHDLVVNSSTIDLSKLLSSMKQTKTGRLLNISDSTYYSPKFSNGVNIYNNFEVYSDIVKYLYSSNADTKDLQILTLLNEYKSNKAVLSLEADLRRIKLILLLICERLRIPNIQKIC